MVYLLNPKTQEVINVPESHGEMLLIQGFYKKYEKPKVVHTDSKGYYVKKAREEFGVKLDARLSIENLKNKIKELEAAHGNDI